MLLRLTKQSHQHTRQSGVQRWLKIESRRGASRVTSKRCCYFSFANFLEKFSTSTEGKAKDVKKGTKKKENYVFAIWPEK